MDHMKEKVYWASMEGIIITVCHLILSDKLVVIIQTSPTLRCTGQDGCGNVVEENGEFLCKIHPGSTQHCPIGRLAPSPIAPGDEEEPREGS